MFLEAGVADLFDVFLRNDPPGAAGARIEGQKVGPRLVELEADMPGIGCLDRRHLLLDEPLICGAIELERVLYVLGGERPVILTVYADIVHGIRNSSIIRL